MAGGPKGLRWRYFDLFGSWRMSEEFSRPVICRYQPPALRGVAGPMVLPLYARCRSDGRGCSIYMGWVHTSSDPPHCGGLVTAGMHQTHSPRIRHEPFSAFLPEKTYHLSNGAGIPPAVSRQPQPAAAAVRRLIGAFRASLGQTDVVASEELSGAFAAGETVQQRIEAGAISLYTGTTPSGYE